MIAGQLQLHIRIILKTFLECAWKTLFPNLSQVNVRTLLKRFAGSPSLPALSSDIDADDPQIIAYCDRMLHRWLTGIFYGRRSLTSSEINELLRDPKDADQNFIINTIIKSCHRLRYFTAEELRELPLLWIMIIGCYYKSAMLLVRKGADVNEHFGKPYIISSEIDKEFDEKSPILHYLLLGMNNKLPSEKEIKLVRLITNYGTANLQARDSFENTVLHAAVMSGILEMIKMFLQNEADVNAINDRGATPLLLAAMKDNADELLPFLMKYGANALAKDKRGNNALHYLSNNNIGHPDLAKLLIEKGVSLDDVGFRQEQPIHVAAHFRNAELVKVFLDHGANVNAKSEYGKTPLHLAVDLIIRSPRPQQQKSSSQVLKILLKRGANINQLTDEMLCRTALQSACELLNEENIEILVLAGASILFVENSAALFTMAPLDLLYTSSHQNEKNRSVRLMLKTLALRSRVNPLPIKLTDHTILSQFPEFYKYYEECTEQLQKMKLMIIGETCTFFDLFKKCPCQIVRLMRNPEFKNNFENDVTTFYFYVNNLVQAFERVENHYHDMLEQEEVINEAIHYRLPHLIVRKIVDYIFYCKKCENLNQ